MKFLKKIFTLLLILLMLNFYLPNLTFAEQALTKHPPEIRTTPEEDIPMIQEKKKSGWTWLILVALLGGVAAAAGGGGGDSGGGVGGTTTTTGDVTVGW
jgi:uncharacterized membrane protein YfcA